MNFQAYKEYQHDDPEPIYDRIGCLYINEDELIDNGFVVDLIDKARELSDNGEKDIFITIYDGQEPDNISATSYQYTKDGLNLSEPLNY
jgi:hypothetical protein